MSKFVTACSPAPSTPPARASILLLSLLGLLAWPASAQTCTVPGTHGTIQEAIDDPACTSIHLSAQTYSESINIARSLTLAGPAGGRAIVEGPVLAAGPGTAVTLQDLRVENGCVASALQAVDGAEVTGSNLEVEHSSLLPCPTVVSIFADGFESGDTSAWTLTVP